MLSLNNSKIKDFKHNENIILELIYDMNDLLDMLPSKEEFELNFYLKEYIVLTLIIVASNIRDQQYFIFLPYKK